jgi:hypothetical protein
MNPKSHKNFKKGIASEIGIHENVVDDFIAFYYAKLRKNLSELSHPKIFVDGLGTFSVRKNRLEAQIKSKKSHLGNIVNNTYSGYEKKLAIEDRIDEMESLLITLKEQELEKKDFKKNKHGSKKDLEK